MEIKILGQLEITIGGAQIPVRGHRQRALVITLAMNVGQVVPTYKLIDAMWDGIPPIAPLSRYAAASRGCGGTSGTPIVIAG